MDVVFVFGTMSVILGFIVWAWVNGIDRMMREHPDYKGEDLLDEYPPKKEDKKSEWDDNKQHTEQNFKI